MSYDWRKPWLIMHPLVADSIEDPGFWDDVRDRVNILVTSRTPLADDDEAWLIPADVAQRLINFTTSELKHKISEFGEKDDE